MVEGYKKYINSGDFITLVRFSGLNSLIYYSSGSVTVHSVMALWKDGELYILESNSVFNGKHGIIKNKYDDFFAKIL